MRRLQALGIGIGAGAALLGALGLIGGWALQSGALDAVLPVVGAMKANTALGIAALGVNLVLTGQARRSRTAARAIAAVALAVGLATLAQYAFHADFGIDELLFRDPAGAADVFPGRPAAATALMIALLGAAQLYPARSALHFLRTGTTLAAALIAWASINGYVFGAQALREVSMISSVALDTAAAMLLIAMGTFAQDPTSWPVRMVLAKGTGGTVCRWLLPAAVLSPPALGWLLSATGPIAGYPAHLRWALYSTASSLGSAWLILLLAHRIAAIDADRSVATRLSLHDPLTGLANRRAFDAFVLESFNLAKRHHHAMSLVLLDVDRFKSYNDEFGHPAGDALLEAISSLLRAEVRETDMVARIGGEEFALALPETDLAGAWVIAERIRVQVERSALFKRAVTVSAGVAAVTDAISDVPMLVQACDGALYRAKTAGRNQVATAG